MDRKAQQEKLGISWWSPGKTSLQRQTSDNPRLWRCQRLYAVSFGTCWPLQARNPVLHGGLLLTWTKYSFQYFMQGSLPPFTEVWLTFGTVVTCTNTFFLKDKTILYCGTIYCRIAITAIKGGTSFFLVALSLLTLIVIPLFGGVLHFCASFLVFQSQRESAKKVWMTALLATSDSAVKQLLAVL